MYKDKVHESWMSFFETQNSQFLEKRLLRLVDIERRPIYPPREQILRAFQDDFSNVKVVIIGQDPYHGDGQAMGLAFSVNKGVAVPPSLQNIFKELKDDMDIDAPNHGDLSGWSTQGVLLLNSVLTVEKGKPASHKGIGWETLTNNAIRYLSKEKEHLVFILWGKSAQENDVLIDKRKHHLIMSSHPSPFSAAIDFFGSKPFSETNNKLAEWGYQKIDWEVK